MALWCREDFLTDPTLSDFLAHWSRWSQQSDRASGHCLSAESRWNSDWWNGWRESVIHGLPVDEVKAAAVESVLVREDFPSRYRRVLVLFLVRRWSSRDVCRKLGARVSDWEGLYQSARGCVRVGLEQSEPLMALHAKRVAETVGRRMVASEFAQA